MNRTFKLLTSFKEFLHRCYTAFWYVVDPPFCIHRRVAHILAEDRRAYARCMDCGFHFPYGWRRNATNF